MLGLEEQNIDAVVELILDAAGRDVTGVPAPPLGPRAPRSPAARSASSGRTRAARPRQPLGFRVYVGTGPVIDYSLPVLTVDWSSARFGCFSAELAGLGSGSPHSIGVRSYSTVAEEQNTTALIVTPDDSPPSVVDALQATATNQEP